ncbi:MAG: energy transducer TonB [Dysgonamonadaceae bacterium]|jgi:hypothetical protein|nr:energy transducer TonB [Dysgonamonadaceae bacterium]
MKNRTKYQKKKLIIFSIMFVCILSGLDVDAKNYIVAEMPEDSVFLAVEKPAQFPGGEKEMMSYLAQNVEIPSSVPPDEAIRYGAFRFVIQKTGKISNIEVLHSIHPIFDEEIVRVIASMPDWVSAEHGGEKVNMQYILPIHFDIQTLQAQKIDKSPEEMIVNFLTQHCSFKDINPTHQEDADSVNLFVRRIFDKQYTSDDIPNLITQTLQLFYNNSIGTFEDTPDIYRMGIRRSMCYMALAFLSGEYHYSAFLADAHTSLSKLDSDEKRNKMLLIVNVIELYKELSSEYASKKGLEYTILLFQDDLKNKEKDISDESFVTEYKKILSGVANSIRE